MGMKIALVTSIFPPDIGGPATYASEILRRLNARGHTVKVITPSPAAQTTVGVHAIPKRHPKPKFIDYAYTLLALFLGVIRESRDCNIIYTLNPAYVGLVSLMVAKLLRKPVVLRMVGDAAWEEACNKRKTEKFLEEFLRYPEGGRYIRRLIAIQRFVLNRVDKIIVPSHFLKDVVVNYYGVNEGKVRVIYNSIDLLEHPKPPSELSPTSGKPELITVGRLVRHKRVDRVIEVIKEISRDYPEINLSIVGGGPEQENLEKLTQELGIEGHVRFYGKLSHEQTTKLLAEADIFVLDSIYEGLPHVALEAMACRTPVIATNIKGTNEVVKNGETGLLVSPDNNAELKQSIVRLLKDQELRKRLVENAYRSVKDKFTWERNLSILERELEELI